MAISPAPSRNKQDKDTAANEKRIAAIINNGGNTIAEKTTVIKEPEEEILKGITIKLTSVEMDVIKDLRNRRPSPRGKKIAISLHDWIVEAVQDKMEREKRKYDF